MYKLILSLAAVAAIGLFSNVTDSASAQCRGGGGYYHGHGGHYHGGRVYSYRPQTTIGFSYGTGFNNFYGSPYGFNNYYRPVPVYGGYGYRGFHPGYGCNRGGVGFSIRF